MFDAEYSSRQWPNCAEEGCGESAEWFVRNRKAKGTYRFCREHVPPLGTPRMTGYEYRGAIRHEQEKDFEPGDRVTTQLGGRSKSGTIVGYDEENDGWEVKWDDWITTTGFPSHWLKQLSPLQQLAEAAPEEPEWKKYHRY